MSQKSEVIVDGHEGKTLKIYIEISGGSSVKEEGDSAEDTPSSFSIADPISGKILTITIAE
ncbi:hypothetical protein [Leptolyngbya sp. 7M]|uniref:hypothetical protein n=1 Tax=Leptolyngbya sp. 7M TaxID=2812896 RepID=UPI001B8B3EED|nr:hypothetical protein [Leptolyngbya sp. 7M]QYO65479.1 hypothetical protein JVX88_01440 [Leptolyngbya sp. 7M]